MKKKMPQEKRKYARLNIQSKINFSVIETSENAAPRDRFRAIGNNIGVEGIMIISDKEIEPDTILNMEIFFKEKYDPVYIQGEVKRCLTITTGAHKGKYDIGIRFLTVDKNHVLMLIKCLCGSLGEGGPKITL
ncbi:Type IV pilus assembly PilZ domain protein [Candidatus Omnitrophus magneticus]|uniref:Type IV pilus assembly PilZ domain protein n=1 Tax=Candidatus Omnitrophus magneticus TaxID=1609969 RepID=A0A0F0CLP1_9BACT|nr:Type IV pilus assembly PilZ domain protein [Candidatus Omnitrophus magneticus]